LEKDHTSQLATRIPEIKKCMWLAKTVAQSSRIAEFLENFCVFWRMSVFFEEVADAHSENSQKNQLAA